MALFLQRRQSLNQHSHYQPSHYRLMVVMLYELHLANLDYYHLQLERFVYLTDPMPLDHLISFCLRFHNIELTIFSQVQ